MYTSLNPEKDYWQQIRNIFKRYKVETGHIATFPSAMNMKQQPADKIGICNECNKKRPNKNWCKPCYSSHFKKSFNKWTSGNKILNKFIHKSQLSSTSRTSCLEWIPRYHLTDVELLSKNNYCSVYSAIWDDGFIVNWNKDDKCWNRCSGVKVILKTFTKIDNDVSTDFLHEPKAHLNCCVQNACITSFYGFTLDPITNEYLMVLEYAPNGTLRDYIQKNIGTLDWKRKSLILQGIASGLRTIHSANLIHGNIHTGNILQENLRSNIGDFKFATKYLAKKKPFSTLPANANASLSEVYGVMPFIAPEILRGQQPTLSSDIYSFGMIMWELSSLNLPFYDKPHDAQLIMELCGGCRPKIVKETPDAYVSLMKRCWHSDPSKRPTAEELVHITEELSLSMSYKKIGLPEKVLLENKMMESLKNIHPSAVYSSRLLPTLYDIHIQDDNEDNDQWSEYDSEPLIVLKNDNLL